jgi:hypothetical protein
LKPSLIKKDYEKLFGKEADLVKSFHAAISGKIRNSAITCPSKNPLEPIVELFVFRS